MRLADVVRRRASSQELSLGPLLDIVFLLLIFFVVTSTFAREETVPISRPEAASGAEAPANALRVAVSKAERIFVDGQAVQVWSLRDEVRRHLATRRTQDVIVVTDEEVTSRVLVSVVDQVRLAGATDVAVSVEEPL